MRCGRAWGWTVSPDERSRARRSRNDRLTLGAGLAVLAVVWELLARAELISIFYPSPSAILQSLWALTIGGDILENTLYTLARTTAGFALGGGLGLALGFAMGSWPRLHALLDPLIALVHPIPKIAVLPLILVVFGIGEPSKIALGALAAFFPMLINTVAAVRQISPTYFEVARSYGASTRSIFRHVTLPGSLPLVLTGARLSVNVALMLVIAGELLLARQGLGARLWFSFQTMRIGDVYAWLLVTGLVGLALNWGIERLSTWAMPWRDGAGRVHV